MNVRSNEFRSLSRRSAGFTLVELCMGLVITMLVTGALAAFSYALAAGWKRSESGQSLYLAANQATSRIQQVMSRAKQIGLVRVGSIDGSATGAAVMLWKGDANSDGKISFSEIALLQHDPSTGDLKYYEAAPPASDDWLASTTFITNSTAPETFKALTYVTGKKFARNITGAQFFAIALGSHTQRPIFEFTLNFKRNGLSSLLYGSAVLRSVDQASN